MGGGTKIVVPVEAEVWAGGGGTILVFSEEFWRTSSKLTPTGISSATVVGVVGCVCCVGMGIFDSPSDSGKGGGTNSGWEGGTLGGSSLGSCVPVAVGKLTDMESFCEEGGGDCGSFGAACIEPIDPAMLRLEAFAELVPDSEGGLDPELAPYPFSEPVALGGDGGAHGVCRLVFIQRAR